jgi:hypothetical protein
VPRTIKTIAILLLLAVMPLRALAAVTVGFCAMGQHEAPVQVATGETHDHGGHDGGHGHEPQPDSAPDCNACVEHCSSASFAVPAPLETLVSVQRSGRIVLGERFAAGFVPDHLDPPPLAL